MRIAGTDTSFIDGDGIAFVVYFQGCLLDCPGCHNPQLQDMDGGYESGKLDIDESFYDSVVLLGGEPLMQPSAVISIIESTNLPVWLYTGYEYEDIPPLIRSKVHTIVCGPYDETKRQDGFPASSNQRVFREGKLCMLI